MPEQNQFKNRGYLGLKRATGVLEPLLSFSPLPEGLLIMAQYAVGWGRVSSVMSLGRFCLTDWLIDPGLMVFTVIGVWLVLGLVSRSKCRNI